MDDIYGDLENYNDVNALDELRNENTQLKFKLEEYASDMIKLQKDFDKLSSDFKTLEINYSSLLKTAKAEIERKTQIICNLNSEKDKLVLNSIQNTNKSILNIRRNLLRDKSHNYNLRVMKKDNGLDCCKTNRKDLRDTKKNDFEKERKDEIRIPSEGSITSMSTEECMEKKQGKSNTIYEKNSGTKENITRNKSRAQSIKNRRKSMPILGRELPKFSSDEENYDNSADETKKKDRYTRDEKSRRNPERNYSEKVKHKISETSGIDEKYSSYHESSRETYYKGKSTRQSDRYRSIRDKYEQSQRLRRHFSPERSSRKARDHSAEYYPRSDYGRHRVLESPPPDRLEIQKRNRRFNYERENQHEDKHRSRYEKNSASIKHKLLTEYEEPASKRIRTNSSNRKFEEERIQNKLSPQNAIPSRITDPLQLTSCQSPDYIDPETVTPVKEIMSPTNIQLEDPRLRSQKYVTQNENDKVIICTVTGRNIELKPIDSSTWDTKQVEIPEALKHPPHYTDELKQQSYQDVDKPVSYMTPESGEIQSDNELHDIVTDSYFNVIYEEEKQRARDRNIYNLYEKGTQRGRDLNIHNIYEKESKDLDSRISRISHNNTHNSYQPYENVNQFDIPLTEYVIDHSKQENNSDTKITIKLSKKETENSVKQKNCEHENIAPAQNSGEDRVLSCREIVEGDLALSDETSDNVDTQLKIKDKRRTRSQNMSVENKTSMVNIVANVKDKNSKERYTRSTNQVEKAEEQSAEKTKKPKSKRKSYKFKLDIADERQKSKKESKKIGQIQEKITDLFGDSSSLITPEDLGISAVPNNKYDSLFEHALDVNDINIEIAQPQMNSDETTEVKEEVSQKPKQKKKKSKNNDEKRSTESREGEKDKDPHNVEIAEPEKKSVEPTEVREEVSQKPKEKKKKSKNNDEKRSSVETREGEKGKDSYTINFQAVTKEQDVVSTVVISTGIQPQVDIQENFESIVDEHADLNVSTKQQQLQEQEEVSQKPKQKKKKSKNYDEKRSTESREGEKDKDPHNVEIAEPEKKSEKKSVEPTEVREEVSQKPKEKKKKSKNNDEKRSSVETPEGEKGKDSYTINFQAVTKEQDVVSTVVISTGIQPQVDLQENFESIVDEHADLNILTKQQQLQTSAALATSTPYKEPKLRIVESSCNSNEIRMIRNENSPPSDFSSNIDMSSQMETDTPDLKIVVKRRKAVKRTVT